MADNMAGVYTEQTLQPLEKIQLVKLFLNTQEQTSNTISTQNEEVKEMNHNFKIFIFKKVNDVFVK